MQISLFTWYAVNLKRKGKLLSFCINKKGFLEPKILLRKNPENSFHVSLAASRPKLVLQDSLYKKGKFAHVLTLYTSRVYPQWGNMAKSESPGCVT